MNDMEKNLVSEGSEDFAAMFEETMIKFRPGQVVKGVVAQVSDEMCIRDRAYTGLEKGDAAMASVLSPACLSLREVSVSYRMCTNGLNARLIPPIPCVKLAKGGETASHEVPSHYFESIRNAVEMREGAHAVSYTHLDVYKRQDHPSSGRTRRNSRNSSA